MRARNLLVAAVVILLTLLGYWIFPGHTYLQSDTQIYLPILEHLWEASVLGNDLLAREPHVSFTIYDEVAVALRGLTGWGFRDVLTLEQLVFRALGLWGVFLLAGALKLGTRPALLVTALVALGATIAGPTVLSLEYEPVPRGFAVPLLLLALGLAAQGRDLGAGIAAALAFLYHPPTVYPFWLAYFCLTLCPAPPAVMKRRIRGLLPIGCGVAALFLLSRLQTGVGEPQAFFARIDPSLEQLQRLRAPYNWISTWDPRWIRHYVFLWLVGLAAFWRVRKSASQDLKFLIVGLPTVSVLSMPLSYLLLEKLKWSLIPQVQPMRALLFVTVMAEILSAVAAAQAAGQKRWWESFLWLLPALAIPVHTRVLDVLLPDLSNPLIRRRVLLILLLAALAVAALLAEHLRPRWPRWALWTVAVSAPLLLIPTAGKVVNYPTLDNPELQALASWARSSTPKAAMFLFPDAGRQLYPGIFRAQALRAVYTDWKSGGQVNFLKVFARGWWPRWQQTMAGKFQPEKVAYYKTLGIDYLVVLPGNRLPGRSPVYENSRFLVYVAQQ